PPRHWARTERPRGVAAKAGGAEVNRAAEAVQGGHRDRVARAAALGHGPTRRARGDGEVRRRRSRKDHVVEEGVGRISRVIVVVAKEGQRVAVASNERGRTALHPGAAVRASLAQQRGRGAGSVVGQARGGPVVGDRVWTVDLIPEGKRSDRCRSG